MSSDWPSEKSDPTRKAREAAEALFRPKPSIAPVAPVSPGNGVAQTAERAPADHAPASPAPAGQPAAPRQPRILAAPPPRRPHPEPQPPAVEARAPRARPRRIPAGEHRRIVTLVTYGMTSAEVAALYEVSAEVIDKILAAERSAED